MAGEIRLIVSKGGRVKILDKGGSNAQFTEKLAKDLGKVEERHKGSSFEQNNTQQQVEQH